MNMKGQVLSVGVDEQTIIPYILTTLNDTELAFKMASRANLPGADDLYIRQYHQLFQRGQFLTGRSSLSTARWQMKRRGTSRNELVRLSRLLDTRYVLLSVDG